LVLLLLLSERVDIAWLVEFEEVTTEIDLISIDGGLRIREAADSATSKVESRLNLHILRNHGEGLRVFLFLSVCQAELDGLEALCEEGVHSSVSEWIGQVVSDLLRSVLLVRNVHAVSNGEAVRNEVLDCTVWSLPLWHDEGHLRHLLRWDGGTNLRLQLVCEL
jgi:hypothetical protein